MNDSSIGDTSGPAEEILYKRRVNQVDLPGRYGLRQKA